MPSKITRAQITKAVRAVKSMNSEAGIQKAVCEYIRLQYPDVIFTSESGGIRLTMGQAVKAKKLRSGNKLPDLMIFEPNQHHIGMFLELKRDRKAVFLKSGAIKSDEHVKGQALILDRLKGKGYYAAFACGFDDAVSQIEIYMANR